MDQSPLHFNDANLLTAFPPEAYLGKNTSTASSPSPVMWLATEQYAQPQEQLLYEGYPDSGYAYPQYQSPQAMPVVEFTDLTAPYQEDRRRRRSQVQDKQAISSMHMRRRAQNRASQRAFRERKEQHARDLQKRLDELQDKHQQLQESYEDLGGVNKKLRSELESLKDRISAVHASQAQLERYTEPGDLESFESDSAASRSRRQRR